MTAMPELRREAATRFEALGWPTSRQESWRYFNVRKLREGGFAPVHEAGDITLADLPAPLGSERIVIVDGAFASPISHVESVAVRELSDSHQEHFDGVARQLDDVAMAALNTQHFRGGLALTVPDGAACEEAVEVLFVHSAGEQAALASPRLFIQASRHAQLNLIFRFVSLAEGRAPASLTNALIHVKAVTGARIRTATVCDEHAAATHVHTVLAEVGRDAHYANHVIMQGGASTRSELRVLLQEPGASCDLRGLYVATGDQVQDNYTQIEHIAPHTSSNELYRGLIDDAAVGTFQGRVLIGREARNSEAHQLNNNLLLGERAVANTKPQLEIDIDEVVASHGSTVGSLDRDALFYLESRGLAPERARGLLTFAFAREVLDGMCSGALASALAHELEAQLSGGADHASWPQEL